MNQTSTIIKALCLLLFPAALWGQSAGDYRTAAAGPAAWSTVASWETFDGTTWNAAVSTPTSANGVITIRTGHTINLTASVTADQLVIEAGATLNNNTGGANLTLNDGAGTDLTISGTYLLRALNVLTSGGGSPTMEVNGTMNWFSGTVQIPTTINSGGILNLDLAFDKILQNASIVNNGTINWITITSNGNLDMRTGTLTNNGTINANFGVNAGFFNTSGVNLFTNNGTLHKSTAQTLAINTLPFTNSATGVITGTGTLSSSPANFSITNAGEIQPGSSPGQITFSNNIVSTETSTLRLEIVDGSGAGTGHDKVNFNTAAANVDVSGTDLIVQALTSAPIQSYTILENTGGGVFTGAFASVLIPLNYSITYNPGVSTSIIVTKLGATLPAVWGSFNAIARNNQVSLKWETLQESNVADFTVEYSVNGRDYLPLTTVAAIGNSNSVQSYSFVHTMPDLAKSNFYRIKQTDLDGKSAYSAVRSAKFTKGQIVAVTATPNPVRDRLQLQVQEENIRIVLTDMAGKTIQTLTPQPGYHEINMSLLSPGIYNLAVFNKNSLMETQKIVKQ